MPSDAAPAAPIRVLHHWACSGGTVISRCIASQPQVVLLSEVHPLAYLRVAQAYPYYFPTDLIQQLSLPHNGRDPALCLATFNGAIDGLHELLRSEERTLVLRSHSHVDFFSGVMPASAPLISVTLANRHQLLELLSVRHPLDSWLSLCQQGWDRQFCFSSLTEFCNRALAMLEACAGMPLLRYEDFCSQPETGLSWMADKLALELPPSLLNQLSGVNISGDSGRRDAQIGVRCRRPIPHPVARELNLLLNPREDSPYQRLCDRLGYRPDPASPYPFTNTPAPWDP